MTKIEKLNIDTFKTEERIIEYAIYDLERKLNEIIEVINEVLVPEVCICAAIKTPKGVVIRGNRHADAIRTAIQSKKITKFDIKDSIQGFVTSKNRFVDRKEGFKLQHEAGVPSVNKSGYFTDELYSEDLY